MTNRIILYTTVLCSLSLGATKAFQQSIFPSRQRRRLLLGPLLDTPTPQVEPSVIISHDALQSKNILVVGGSGRVGGSVVTHLVQQGAKVTVGGTNEENFDTSRLRWQKLFPSFSTPLSHVGFQRLDRESATSVTSVLDNHSHSHNFDLVVHTAGPFQGKVNTPNGVLDACVSKGVPYIDVCDDYCTAMAAKAKFSTKAVESGTPCIVSTGCWPGVSSLMAKQLVAKSLEAYPSLQPEDLAVDFGFFTAGSGGAGSTLLVATFLILAEEALTIVNGRRKPVDAMKEYSRINFGQIVGNKDIAHLNLLETASVHDVLGVGNVKSLFGTAPGFWNTLLGLMAQLPSSLLANEEIMSKLAIFSLPIVRVVDFFAGATNAMRCDVYSQREPSLQATALYAHENLEPCVGECVGAFCAALLTEREEGRVVPPGVWFPEEAIQDGSDAANVLRLASTGAHTVEVHSSIGLTQQDVWGGPAITTRQSSSSTTSTTTNTVASK